MRKTAYLLVALFLMLACFFAGRALTTKAPDQANAHRVLYWVDPMHPSYKSEKPGIAPDCGMQLEPVYADGSSDAGNDAVVAGAVHVTTEQQQLIGVRTDEATNAAGNRTLRVSGRVVADEQRIYKIYSGTDGYIDKTFQDTTGTRVKKDQLLATFSGPEFVTAEQNYLFNVTRTPDSYREVHNQNDWRSQTDKLNLAKLQSLGMSEQQIKQITQKGQASTTIDILSPIDGFIIGRAVSPGQRFDKGAEFYRIADLSHVWIYADVFENEAGYFRPGTMAMVSSPQTGKTVHARVADVLSQFDSATRTLKVRLEADNPGYELRPDMFVDVELHVRVPPGLSVPADAVLDSGMRKRVFVDRGNGFFEPREVETGWRTNNRVQITKGLQSGERVVVSGTFLLDSDSRLKATTSANAAPEMTSPSTTKSEMKTDAGHHDSKMATSKMGPEQKMPSGKQKDLSCGMEVDPAESAAAGNVAVHNGKTYYFCSKSCKSKFEKDPEKYLAASHEGMPHD